MKVFIGDPLNCRFPSQASRLVAELQRRLVSRSQERRKTFFSFGGEKGDTRATAEVEGSEKRGTRNMANKSAGHKGAGSTVETDVESPERV